jgi:hypothetical protein
VCHFYKLEGKTTVPVTSEEFFLWAATHPDERHAVVSQVGFKDGSSGDEVSVSTVFLGVNHRFIPGQAPLVFETMVFGGTMDNSQWRYSTWEEAEAGHERVLQQLYKEMPNLLKSQIYTDDIPTRFSRSLRSDL